MAAAPDSRLTLRPLLLLWAVLAVGIYLPSLGPEFLNWDDPGYITKSAEIAADWPTAAKRIFGSFHFCNYNPLQRLSFYFEWRLAGGSAWLFRILSLGWHLLNTVLVWQILRSWLPENRLVAPLAATLFLVLPPNVENVAWVSERKTLMATAFALLAVLLWLRERPGPALATFAFGLLCKTSIVVLPLLLVLLDHQRRRRLRPGWYVAFAAPALAAGIVQVLAARGSAITELHGGSLPTHLATVVAVLPAYAWSLVWPFGHVPRQLFEPVMSAFDARLLIGLGLWTLLVFGCVRSFRGERRLLVALGFGLAALHLTLLVPIPILLADRYLYLPAPLLLGVAVDAFLRWRPQAMAPRIVTIGCTALAALGTALYAGAWHDSTALWSHTVKHQPEDAEAWISLADARLSAGDTEGALAAYGSLLARHPYHANGIENLALLELRIGRHTVAAARLRDLLQRDPKRPRAWSALGCAYDLAGDPERAGATFITGRGHCPDDLSLARNHAQFHVRRGEKVTALRILHGFQQTHPDDPNVERAVLGLFAAPSR